MGYDPDRFCRAYGMAKLPMALSEGWQLTGVTSDRVRPAVDFRLVHPSETSSSLIVFVERLVPDAPSLASTEHLQLSYYDEGDIDHALAARLVRELSDALRQTELERPAETADALFVRPRAHARALELRINRECNEACVFCNTPEDSETILPSKEAIYDAIRRERSAGYNELTLTGRETTLDPELVGYVRAARDAGYRAIRVQTNGTAFADGPMLERLVDAGMTMAEVSLHTLEPETFRRLVGPPRLLEKTLAALKRLADFESVRVHLVVVMTKLNLAHVEPVLRRVLALHPGLSQVTLSPMAPVGDGAERVDLVPRPAELAEPLRAAFVLAEEHGLEIRIPSRCGTPLCAMPTGLERFNAEIDNEPGLTLEAAKAKPARCASCVYFSRCTGLWSACLDTWGDDVVTPVTKWPAGLRRKSARAVASLPMHSEIFETTVGDETFEGFVARPDGDGVRPAVLVCHAWSGRGELEDDKARALADLGYVGVAVDVYGKGQRGGDPSANTALMGPLLADRALLRRRLHGVLDAVRQRDDVDASRVAAIGFCFGGLCVLDIARAGTDLRGVVSFHGALGGALGIDNASFLAKVLVLHGDADPLIGPEQVAAFTEEMRASGADWQIHFYGGAMHSFTNPNANDPQKGAVYHPDAARRSWATAIGFLAEVLR